MQRIYGSGSRAAKEDALRREAITSEAIRLAALRAAKAAKAHVEEASARFLSRRIAPQASEDVPRHSRYSGITQLHVVTGRNLPFWKLFGLTASAIDVPWKQKYLVHSTYCK